MKKDKRRVTEILLEIILELVLTALFVGIGIFVLYLFGGDISIENIDFELVALIGVVIFIVIFIAAYAIINRVKNKRKK